MPDFYPLIAKWYRQNLRDLPWRHTNDPYKIWLSEIILQQTRVEQGQAYYEKFVDNYPDVNALARAEENDVLNLWQGLGYYSRARNLHAASKHISKELNGEFPKDFKAVLNLKGVGTYTASAIMSFAYNKAFGVVDGNVYRVLSRVFDIETEINSSAGKKEFQQLADELISKEHPAEHNQAIMELGALICKPKNPKCNECPLESKCLALDRGNIDQRPVKTSKTKVRQRYFHFMVIKSSKGLTYIKKRMDKDIWKHLYQFPLIELENSNEKIDWINETNCSERFTTTHILSHQKLNATFYLIHEFPKQLDSSEYQEILIGEIGNYPLPRLIDRYLESHPIHD